MKKLRVGIIFGGKSAEHEVSVRSARNVYDALDKSKFEPILIGIDPIGRGLSADTQKLLNAPADATDRRVDSAEGKAVVLAPEGGGELAPMDPSDTAAIDVAFPILHGPFGEDGTVQGFLRLAGVPFVGPGVLGSAVGMDKDIMKRLLRDAGIPVGPYRVMRRGEDMPDDLVKELGLPLFIKPANLGSSVGISKVSEEAELAAAIEKALLYDNKILIEQAIKGREFECSVLGNEHPEASVVGEVLPTHDFYSYEAKYLDEHGAAISIPADIPKESSDAIRAIAVKTFRALECEGLSRVDVFLTPEGDVVVNEINTLPGFTSISMYPKLWEASGLSYTDLITKLIDLAIERHRRDSQLKSTVD